MSQYMTAHRWVAEQTLGRKLLPTEVVHHVNGDKLDNRPENLEVMDRATHARLHTGARSTSTPRGGSRLLSARKATDLSREKVAARIGVCSKTIERWETGTCPVKRYQLARLAEIYGVAVADLTEAVAA